MTLKVLVIAPHPDDEILGAGGAIKKYSENGDKVFVLTVAGHMPPLYSQEVYQKTLAEAKIAHDIVGVHESIFLDLPATTLGLMATAELNGKIHEVVSAIGPDIVLLPYPDRHVDHRIIFDSALVSTRPVGIGGQIQLVAAYETLSETHWNAPHIEPNFTPNWVINITDHIQSKLMALEAYESQIPPFPGPRSLQAVQALATFRGTQAGFAAGEAFHLIRMRS